MSNLSKPLMLVAAIVSTVGLTSHRAISAEQTRVLSAVGMRQVLVELVPIFERATGHSVHLAYDSGAMIVRRIEAGGACCSPHTHFVVSNSPSFGRTTSPLMRSTSPAHQWATSRTHCWIVRFIVRQSRFQSILGIRSCSASSK